MSILKNCIRKWEAQLHKIKLSLLPEINMNYCHQKIALFIFGLLVISCQEKTNISTEEILSTFQIEEGFQIELVASEPLISDPVAMAIDENGRMYVLEMHGYPIDVEGSSVVKILKDTDGDGIMDESKIFHKGLIVPTGIMLWKKGILVTDPPNVLYLEDSDGDDVADKIEIILSGYALSNPQHNVNNPIYGLDNWIYLADDGTINSKDYGDIFGDKGEEVHFPRHPDAPKLPRNANGLNTRFNPDNLSLEMLSSKSQFGHTFDQWGHHFVTSNGAHLFHEVMGANYLLRNQNLVMSSTRQYVPDYGIGFEIFPITENPEHQLLTDVGAITSSCGVTWYLGDLFPKIYQSVTFIAEPTHNLVHTDIVYDKGATFGSKNQFKNREFLASTDGWFRPVNFYNGPFGELYMVDFYRKIIEHPEWLSEEVINSGDLTAGSDQGRIYRIVYKGYKYGDKANNEKISLSDLADEELIAKLKNQNIWWRRNTQRLIVDRQQKTIVPPLKNFINETNSSVGLIHGLWTLEGLHEFDKSLLLTALEHPEGGVRENAIKIAELHRDEFVELEDILISMANDPDPKVRFQILCTLGYYESDKSQKAREQLLFTDIEDTWTQVAALSASYQDELSLIKEASIAIGMKSTKEMKSFFKNLGKTIGKQGNAIMINKFFEIVLANQASQNSWWQAASIGGLSQTIDNDLEYSINKSAINSLEGLFTEHTDPDLRSKSLEFLNTMGHFKNNKTLANKAHSIAFDKKFSPDFRSDAVKVISWSSAEDNLSLFQKLLNFNEPVQIQKTAIWALGKTKGVASCSLILELWKTFAPEVKVEAIKVFMVSDERKELLLEAIQSSKIQQSSIGWSASVQLLNSKNDSIRKFARSILQGNQTSADAVWLDYQAVLSLKGDINNGQDVFKQSCAVCHQISGMNGTNYGPDLAEVRNRNKAGILVDVIKPNKSIADGFELWMIKEKNNDLQSGIISQEGVNSITLRNILGEENVILRADIESISASEYSAMPESLHTQINHQDMADLLEYLKN